MTVAAFAGYSVLGLVEYARFRTGVYDLVIFDQAVRDYSHFGLGGVYVKEQWNHLGFSSPLLGDHFSPILILLAPLYWVFDGPQTLIVAQAFLFAVAAIPLWVLTRRTLGQRSAHAIAAAYLLSWPLAEAVAFHFHEYAFMPLVTAVLFERLQAGRKAHVIAAAVVMLLIKEDVGLFVAGLGLAQLWRPGWRILGGAMAALGPVAVLVTSQVVIPAFGGSGKRYWYYSGLGDSPLQVIKHVVTDPIDVLHVLVTPGVKLATVALLLGPLLLLPLLSPYVLAPLTLIVERMLATDQPGWWGTQYHYNAAVIMGLICAGVDGVNRLQTWLRKRSAVNATEPRRTLRDVVRMWSWGCAAVALALVAAFPLRNLATPSWYQQDPREASAEAAVAVVPDGALVEAANQLGPALSARTKVVMWRDMPKRAPWVVADTRTRQPIFTSLAAQQADVTQLQQRGYQLVFARDGFIVLRDGGSSTW